MKSTIWIFSLEPIETRYTAQWHSHVPNLLKNRVGDKFNVVQIDGIQKNSTVTPGAFLNFSDTNYWKSAQMCEFLEQHNQGKTGPNDHFIFTDAWNPIVIQLKYMSDLLGFNWTLHGMFHAGSYDPQDFLGRLVGNKPWVRHAEKSFFHAFDHNYFASHFHIDMFVDNLLENGVKSENPWAEEDKASLFMTKKIVRSGWPMEYMNDILAPYTTAPKRDLILFPHRIAPEKQVEIFKDLALHLPQYEFVVCQEQTLSKQQYHELLSQAKIVFSANLQETLGISCYEGSLINAIPMVPDRLSYKEMYYPIFKYPSEYTEDFGSYLTHRQKLCDIIGDYMNNYNDYVPYIKKQSAILTDVFFSAEVLLKNIR